MTQTILVPSDASERANEALEVAFERADADDADVHVLFVVDTRLYGEPALSSFELFVDDLEDQSHEFLDEVVDRGRDQGVDVTPEMQHGVPEVAIVEYADEIDADLIVMGYWGEDHRTKMGTVVKHVLETIDRPVLVV